LQENDMAGVAHRSPPRLSIELFRGFLEGRPDEERWELIDGVPVMMAPPTLAHQLIASNLQRLLYEALERFAPTLAVYQRAGINLGPSIEYYDPEPDVVVIDADASQDPSRRYADRFYLAAEIVSSSDRAYVESKRAVYMQHEACKCILTVQQDRFDVRIDQRTASGWSEQNPTNPDDPLILPEFGVRCVLSDLYRGTALVSREGPKG
jgi:Uma2 family endonuclease